MLNNIQGSLKIRKDEKRNDQNDKIHSKHYLHQQLKVPAIMQPHQSVIQKVNPKLLLPTVIQVIQKSIWF